MKRKVAVAVGITLIAMLGLSACSAPSTPPVPTAQPTASTPTVLQEPSTDTLSATEVDAKGMERVTANENDFLAAASLGDVDPIAPDEGALSFPDYVKQSGAALPTAEYALNLSYWACAHAAENPPSDGKLETLVNGTYDAMLAVTGYTDSSPAAQAYGDLMFRGASILCDTAFTQYADVPEEGAP